MRALLLLLCVVAAGCGARPLPTTLFFMRLAPEAAPDEQAWRALAAASRTAGCEEIVALAPSGTNAWIVWCAARSDASVLVDVRRTDFGLEAQSLGRHDGPRVRPTIRALDVGRARVVIVESSRDAESTEREAALYVERGSRIIPLTLGDRAALIAVRAERMSPLESGWARAETLTATLEAATGGILVHEHASVREIAVGRPELAARATYEVERARFLRGHADALEADRPSLFDDPS